MPRNCRTTILLAAAMCAGLAGATHAASPELARKAPEAALLEGRIAKDGAVRVIVKLAVQSTASSFSRSELASTRSGIATVRERFLSAQIATDPGRRSRLAVRGHEYLPYVAMTVNAADLEAVAADPRVAAVYEDAVLPPLLLESVPLIAGGKGIADLQSIAGADGAGQTVAIMDSGVDVGHPFLGGRVTHEACFSTAVGPGRRSLCPDGKREFVGPGAAGRCPADNRLCWHGTHVAGIAAGLDKSSGGRGVAPKAKIIAIQAFHLIEDAATCTAVGYTAPCIMSRLDDMLAGFNHLIGIAGGLSEPLAAINVSIGGGRSETSCNGSMFAPAVVGLRQMGVATVFASGNSGFRDATTGQTGCIEAAVVVGSTTKQDAVSGFSNISPLVDLLAPGSDIVSSVMGGKFAKMGGTSMAAPHVAGTFAAIRTRFPKATVDQIEAALKSTGIAIPDNRPEVSDRNLPPGRTTLPRIRVDLALKALAAPAAASAPAPAPAATAGPAPAQPPVAAPAAAAPAARPCRDSTEAANAILNSGSADEARCK